MNTSSSMPHSAHRTTALRVFSAFSLQAFRLSLAALFLAGTPLLMAQTARPLSQDVASKNDAVVISSTVVNSGTSARPGTSSPATAPGDDEVFVMGVFDVRAERDTGYMAANVESATRLDAAIVDIPMNITVFNEEFLKDFIATTIDDVIMFDATVNVYGDGWGDDYTMRGMGGSSVGGAGATFYNGFEQQSGRGLQTLVNTQRIEILKGPNAVLYGQGAFGGTINRTSKKPQFKNSTWTRGTLNDTGHYQVHVDNQDTLVRGQLAYRLNMLYGKGRMWDSSPRDEFAVSPVIRWRPSRKTEIILEYAYQRVKGREGYAEQPIFDADPFNAVVDGVKVPVPLKYVGNTDDYRLVKDGIFYADFRHEFNRYLSLRAMFNAENKTVDYFETHAAGMYAALQEGQVLISRHTRWIDQKFENYRSRVELVVNNYPTWIIKHKLLAGFGWEKLRSHQKQMWTRQFIPSMGADGKPYYDFGGVTTPNGNNFPYNQWDGWDASMGTQSYSTLWRYTTPADLLTYTPGPNPWTKETLPAVAEDSALDSRNLSFYFSDLMSLFNERLYLQFGLRYSVMKRRNDTKGTCSNYLTANDVIQQWVPTPVELQTWLDPIQETYNDYPLTHSAGLVWHITRDKSWTFYVNNNATYQPNYNLMLRTHGPQLPPMTGNQFEAGFKWVYKDKLYLTACYYDIKQKNVPWQMEVTYLDEEGLEQRDWGWGTIAGLHSKGVELQFNANLSNQFRAMLSFAYTDCVNTTDQRSAPTEDFSRRHYNVSRHAAAGLLSYRLKSVKGLQFTGGFQWRNSQLASYTTPSASMRKEPQWMVPRFLEIRAGAAYAFRTGKMRWTARVDVRNLTDEKNGQFAANVRIGWRAPRITTLALESTF